MKSARTQAPESVLRREAPRTAHAQPAAARLAGSPRQQAQRALQGRLFGAAPGGVVQAWGMGWLGSLWRWMRGSQPAAPSEEERVYGDQRIWREGSVAAVGAAREALGERRDLPGVLGMLAERRKNIARAQRSPNAEQFGAPRRPWREAPALRELRDEDRAEAIGAKLERFGGDAERADDFSTMQTPMAGAAYRDAGRAAKAALGLMEGENEDFRPVGKSVEVLHDLRGLQGLGPDSVLRGRQSQGRIGERRVPLTASLFGTPDAEHDEADRSEGVWLHTRPEQIPVILAHAQTLHAQVLEGGEAAARFRRLGEVAWWLFHAVPYERGSAGIVEWYLRAMTLHLGGSAEAEFRGLDLRTFRESMDGFAASFAARYAPAAPGGGLPALAGGVGAAALAAVEDHARAAADARD